MCIACAVGASAAAPSRPDFPEDDGPLPWREGRPAGGTLRWTGVAGLRLDLDGTAIAFDPFVTRPGLAAVLLRRPRIDEQAVAARFADLDAVFVGHTHYDHAMDLVAVASASPRALFHGSETTVELLRRQGVDSSRLVVVEDASRHAFGPFEVETVAAEHGKVPLVRFVDRRRLGRGMPRTPFRYPRGRVFAWRVRAAHRVLHVHGSAGIDQAALDRQGPADALVACVAARRGTPDYLERLGERLRPDLLLPCHHDDFFRSLDRAPRLVATARWPAFLEEAAALGAAHGTRLHCPPLDRAVTF